MSGIPSNLIEFASALSNNLIIDRTICFWQLFWLLSNIYLTNHGSLPATLIEIFWTECLWIIIFFYFTSSGNKPKSGLYELLFSLVQVQVKNKTYVLDQIRTLKSPSKTTTKTVKEVPGKLEVEGGPTFKCFFFNHPLL